MSLSPEALEDIPVALHTLPQLRGRFPILARDLERMARPTLSMRPPDYRVPEFTYQQRDVAGRRWAVRATGGDWMPFTCRGSGALILGRLLALRGRSITCSTTHLSKPAAASRGARQ